MPGAPTARTPPSLPLPRRVLAKLRGAKLPPFPIPVAHLGVVRASIVGLGVGTWLGTAAGSAGILLATAPGTITEGVRCLAAWGGAS